MKLFKGTSKSMLAFTGKVSDKLQSLQNSLAKCLNRRTANFSRWQQQLFLLLICLLFGGMSLYLLIKAIY